MTIPHLSSPTRCVFSSTTGMDILNPFQKTSYTTDFLSILFKWPIFFFPETLIPVSFSFTPNKSVDS